MEYCYPEEVHAVGNIALYEPFANDAAAGGDDEEAHVEFHFPHFAQAPGDVRVLAVEINRGVEAADLFKCGFFCDKVCAVRHVSREAVGEWRREPPNGGRDTFLRRRNVVVVRWTA